MDLGLKDKRAFVGGGSRGIGKAIALELAREGCDVVIASRTKSVLEEAAKEIEDITGRRIIPMVLDVTSREDVDCVMAEAASQLGGLDILVNNAGLLIEGTAEETDDATWDKIFDVNLKGLFRGCRAVIPEMRQRGGGAIVNLASIDALSGAIGHLAYSASKGGVTALTRSLATDHAVDGIRVNAVCPGTITTPMVEKMFKDTGDIDTARNASIAKHPLGRLASADEVASVITFLCSNDASFITGQSVSVDGGRSIR